MYPRKKRRWETTFGKFVANQTVAGIVRGLHADPATRITRDAVYEWLAGHRPHPTRALALVRLSAGQLTLEDVFAHATELRAGRRRRRVLETAGST